eukprot:5824475-Alexandrium_andersonii.AAC.1
MAPSLRRVPPERHPLTGGLPPCLRVRQVRRGDRFLLLPPALAVPPCGRKRSALTCSGEPLGRAVLASVAVLPAERSPGVAKPATRSLSCRSFPRRRRSRRDRACPSAGSCTARSAIGAWTVASWATSASSTTSTPR